MNIKQEYEALVANGNKLALIGAEENADMSGYTLNSEQWYRAVVSAYEMDLPNWSDDCGRQRGHAAHSWANGTYECGGRQW
jgi:nucleoside-specific outer membrane channel protein Tsx